MLFEAFLPWFQSKDIKQIFITHNHEDHTGGAVQLQQLLHTPIYIFKQSVPVVKQVEPLPIYRQF